MRALTMALLSTGLVFSAQAKPVDIGAPKPATKKQMAVLASSISNADMRDPANAVAFLHLAAKDANARLTAKALVGMAQTWSRRAGGKRPQVNKAFRKVVLARLKGKSAVLSGALQASRLLLGGDAPYGPAVDRVLKLTKAKGAATRYAAVRALFNVRDFQLPRATGGLLKGRVVKAFLGVLQGKTPWLLAATLERLARAAFPGSPESKDQIGAAEHFAKHEDAALRGLALRLRARLTPPKQAAEVAKVLKAAAKDPSPFVRAAALGGLVSLSRGAATLVAALDDEGVATLEQKGIPGLAGKQNQHLGQEGPRTVSEAGLYGLRTLSKGMGKKGFNFKDLGARNRAARRAAAVTAAKTWYAANKGKLK